MALAEAPRKGMTFLEVLQFATKHLAVKGLEAFFAEVAGLETDERYRRMTRAESYYLGTQYIMREANWDGRKVTESDRGWGDRRAMTSDSVYSDVPHYLRRPFVTKQLCATVVHRLTGLLYGNKQVPHLRTRDKLGQPFVDELMKWCNWWATMTLMRNYGGGVGSAGIGIGVEKGAPFVEIANGKHCMPVFEDDDVEHGTLKAMRIAYERPKKEITERRDATGKLVPHIKETTEFYCRIITEQSDVAMVSPDGKTDWQVVSYANHMLGFCPWVWVRNLPQLNEIDGVPDCEGQWDNLEQIDYILSQGAIGVRVNCDPTLILKTKRSIGTVMTGSITAIPLEIDEAAELLETKGTGGSIALQYAEYLKESVLDDVRCVLDEGKAQMSASRTATELVKRTEAMYEHVDALRGCYSGPMEETMEMLIGICRKFQDRLPKKFKGKPLPETDDIDVEWSIEVQMNPTEQLAVAQEFVALMDQKIISRKTAREKLASMLGLTDLDAEERLVQVEWDEALKKGAPQKPAQAGKPATKGATVPNAAPAAGATGAVEPTPASPLSEGHGGPHQAPLEGVYRDFPGAITFYIVDGEYICTHSETIPTAVDDPNVGPVKWDSADFTMGGNWMRYPALGVGVGYLDDRTAVIAYASTMGHEMWETARMLLGDTYDAAHDEANKDIQIKIDRAVLAGDEVEAEALLEQTAQYLRTVRQKKGV